MLICPNLSNKDVAREFNELKSALMAADPKHGEAMAYQVWSLNNGNAIDKAPNGAESQLFNSLVDYYEGNRSKAIVAKAKTYSTNFLKWFGNWTGEKDALPEYERSEVSKVVDENGEPLVVWHGQSSTNYVKDFDAKSTFFTENKSAAEEYGDKFRHPLDESDKAIPVFLNIKNPHIYDAEGREYKNVNGGNFLDFDDFLFTHPEYQKEGWYWDYQLGEENITIPENVLNEYHKLSTSKTARTYVSEKIGKDNDGVIIRNVLDPASGKITDTTPLVTDYVANTPSQIKHVENLGTFNPNDPNIYHNEGEFDSWNEEQQKYYTWLPGAKQRLATASSSNIQQIKSDIIKEFNGLKLKHFTLSILKNKTGQWYIHTGNRSDQKDVKDLRIIAKKIGYTELGVHELSGDQAENLMKYLFSQVHGTSEHMNNIISILKAALKGKNIKIQFVHGTIEDSPAHYNHETGIITININGAFKNSNGYDNIAAQTVLHELIHAVTVETIKRSPELRSELETLFNKVKQSGNAHWHNYKNLDPVYGLTDIYEFIAELSNEDFVKSLQRIHTGSDRKELIPMIVDFMRKVINKILTSTNKQWKGTAYADAMDILMKAAFPEDFNIKQQSEPLDEQTIFNVISARQQAAQDEANRLIVRMNVLYRQYEKIKDKTPSQERLANEIFETLNELKQHRDISAVQIALDQAKLTLGQYDSNLGGPVNVSSIYKYLYDAQQRDFAGVSPQSLVDMYRNSIKFYKDLIEGIPSEQAIDLSKEDKESIAELKSLIDDHIMPIWTQAIMKIGDQIVDEQVDNEVYSSDENKEDMKKVAKDWLHKNLMYGDITAVTSYVYNYSSSSNPIIKQAFHLIQQAEQKTSEEIHHIAPKLMAAYQKANKGTRSIAPGWQSIMMEFDEEGIPTGNFVRDINYGQYQKDFKDFLTKLNKDFVDKYGFTYVVDDTGAVTNSLTGEFAEDEEWGPDGEMPKYVEYLKEIEKFKGRRAHRRYQPNYYLERLSVPYNGTIDPMSPEFVGTRFDHGLSPKTLSRYSYYQSNINYYLNKCQDETSGLVYPERLSPDDRLSLDRWQKRMQDFTSIFNADGSYKIGEDLKMAYEVRAWQKFLGQHTDPKIYQEKFNAELAEVQNRANSTGNPGLVDTFLKYNAKVGINPDYIEQTIGSLRSSKKDTDTSFRGKLLRASLQGMVNNPMIFGRELQKMINNPLFWLQCKASDQAIEDANTPDNTSGWTKDMVEEYQKSFYQKDILYKDAYGFYSDENGNKVNPNDPAVKSLEEAGKLLTVRQYIINRYTDEAVRTGHVTGLIDESSGALIDFSGLSQHEIRNQISTLLSYRKKHFDEDGNVSETYEPLTIFSILAPTKDKFFNNKTGRQEPTIIYVGESRFKDSNSSFVDQLFNRGAGVSEIPDVDFDNGRYDNRLAYDKVMKDNDLRELYELLIQTMKDAQSIYSTNRKFNYKLPQINARTTALLSRVLKRGYSVKAIQGLWNSMTNVEANDELLRTKQDYFVGVDGEVANDIPLKFIRDLKNKEDLSTDLVSSVILFADMAINYKNKSEIDSKLKILRYNMDEDVRAIYEGSIKPRSEQSAKSNANSVKMFDSMMDTSMYGNKFGQTDEEGPSKTRVAIHKTADAFQSLESTAMLGLNMFSMSVGFADSITRILSESVAGKYMTVGDCLWALGKCLYYTPACIKNMFNPLANNKMTALMQMNGISKGTFGIYTKTDWGKGRKFLSSILMGGWSMLDWMANALLMMAFYHNTRLYEGDEIPKGFYTKYEMQQAFMKAGKTKSEGTKAFHNYTNLMSRVTLWDAYGFKNGEAFVKPEYEMYVTQRVKTNVATKTKKRGALYNGMNPDNDVPRWKRDVIGRLAGALRAWIQQQVQHLIAGGSDSVARTFTQQTKFEINSSGTRKKTRWTKDNLTDEQRARRMSWDYETGTPQDQILIGLWRSFKTLYREANQLLLHKPRTAKLSEVEKYAWKDTIIFLSMLAMMMVGWTFIHDDAREVPKPTSREEAGPASMLNPVDYYAYVRDIYIPNQYWKLAVDDIFFRTVEAKISSVNVQQVLDIVNALTALKSGFDNQLGVIELSSTVIGDEDEYDSILKQGGYKFYTKGEKALYKGIGPINNLHTFLTYYGATGNLRWYTNRFGKLYRAFGYDFKTKDKASERTQTGFSGGSFDGGNFGGGNFDGGNF